MLFARAEEAAFLITKRTKCETRVMAKLEMDINKLSPEERLK